MARRRLGFWRRFAVGVVKPVDDRSGPGAPGAGMEHIPGDGGVIIVANHISHADPLVLAHFIYDAGRWPQFLGKASVFKVPVVGWILHAVPADPGRARHRRRGPVARGRWSRRVKDGGAVVIYPEGTTTKEPDLWPMRGKTGAARLALATGAPWSRS